jgi:tyrosyl-tRNA synthetase
MLTFLPLEQIDEMDHWEGSQLNTAKEILAFELTKLVHGEEEAAKAQNAARALFGAGSAEEAPVAEIAESDLADGKIDICGLLTVAGLTASRSEARRAVQQGGVSVAGEKVTDPAVAFCAEQLSGDGLLVKKGKKSFKRVVLK